MGNLETALTADSPGAPPAAPGGPQCPSKEGAPEGAAAAGAPRAPGAPGLLQKLHAGPSCHVRAPSSTPPLPLHTAATSVPLSVQEIESETDVGAPSPSPEEKRASWGPPSYPADMELLCPTPYQSLSVDPGAPGGPLGAPQGAPLGAPAG
ncbi:hypothetical protein ETH_00033855 [Eimeria tenella]|uniref:Uncharacterized protein n=1 Tax=Eimeria tenella TaxID=5802 RepID=U6KP72_EIMTE|nr:hypothetical protein ETH_00033855 [Eimeria tenella]CDJ38703.1 hypothetical protein ETH_00033855 [Eimeria tenella]|eukprot:XP_013229459.1 hypothetical protein ETH_00033855 [Eimeria tenella]